MTGPLPGGGGVGAASRYLRTFTGFERDARIFLLTTLVAGAATSLYWIDFNLYLESLGLSRSLVGLIASAGSIAGVVVAIPAAALSDRLGRRWVMVAAGLLVVVAFAGFLAVDAVPLLFVLAALYGAGSQAFNVVTVPYLAEHSRPEHRSELFAIQFAVGNVTNVAAAIGGGVVAGAVASSLGLDPAGPGPYRVILAMMTALGIAALGTLLLIAPDRPVAARPDAGGARQRRGSFGIHVADRGRMTRLLLPGFLTALGAGQIIPFLNVFVEGRFHLSLAGLNAVFAFTSLGTLVAVLVQPALARRFGKIASVVIVQAASIPFFVVLGWSPLLWTVIVAMAVRNSLMNAGNPIANAFAMEHVAVAERATYSALASLLWSLGWAISGPFYSLVQATFGFDSGYAVNFLTVIVLYSVGTGLYWSWFRNAEANAQTDSAAVTAVAPEPLS